MILSYTEVITPAVPDVAAVLAEVKAALHVTHAFEDELISRLLGVSVLWLEQYLGRELLTKTVRTWFQGPDHHFMDTYAHPYARPTEDLTLPRMPVSSVTAIASYNDANTPTTTPATSYRITAPDRDQLTTVRLTMGSSWPTDLRNLNALSVDYVVGTATDIASLPEDMQQIVYMMVSWLYTNRGGTCDQALAQSGAMAFLSGYRVLRV